jgi:UDP-N-acetylglucosamine/UDP-N-acetylgalactosamine 4-epimerase
MSKFQQVQEDLRSRPRIWLVTGAAGFIGSNLVERLLLLDQKVVALDNFITGKRENIEDVRRQVGEERAANLCFVQGDIREPAQCREACEGVDIVLHQAALGSVPRSVEDPAHSNAHNVDGHLNMLVAAKDAGVRRFVYASSSAVYGDSPSLPKVEEKTGNPLSPYAVTKVVDELYSRVAGDLYGLEPLGLRYFNVFGPRQDPEGPYAAVMPIWISSMIHGRPVYINGTGETSRDFCYIENVVQANILAGTTDNADAINQVYNVALGGRTTLNELYEMIRSRLEPRYPHLAGQSPIYRDFRPGDIMHSQADTSKAQSLLGYSPTHTIERGLDEALDWYCATLG